MSIYNELWYKIWYSKIWWKMLTDSVSHNSWTFQLVYVPGHLNPERKRRSSWTVELHHNMMGLSRAHTLKTTMFYRENHDQLMINYMLKYTGFCGTYTWFCGLQNHRSRLPRCDICASNKCPHLALYFHGSPKFLSPSGPSTSWHPATRNPAGDPVVWDESLASNTTHVWELVLTLFAANNKICRQLSDGH